MALQDAIEQVLQRLYNEGQGNVEAITTPTTASAVVSISDPNPQGAGASVSVLTLHGATPVLTLPAPRVGIKKVLYLVQDATGSRIASWATLGGGAVKWVGAAAPTLTTAAASVDRVIAESYDGTNWVCQAALHIA